MGLVMLIVWCGLALLLYCLLAVSGRISRWEEEQDAQR
jgi:hypothetical protein